MFNTINLFMHVPNIPKIPLRLLYAYICGPALITSSVASDEYFLKFSLKRPPSFVTSSLKLSWPLVQALLGFSISDGTPLQVFGTARLKVSYVS